jgi:type III secretion protein R
LNSAGVPNVIAVIIALAAVALLPLIVVTMTSFLKISVVMFIVRNALGIQQTPPNIVLYSIALVLTVYISSPMIGDIYGRLTERPVDLYTIEGLSSAAQTVKEPVQANLMRFTNPKERQFFINATSKVWPENARGQLRESDMAILLPAFVSSELTRAFEIGFLLYLPFLVIDLIVANILISMGMIMVSPTLMSVPLKLLLFVAVDGWARLMHGLILSYA